MLNRLRDRDDKINKVLDFLREESARGIPILVEGRNDAATLKTLDIEGSIVAVKTGGRSLLQVVSDLEERNVKETILLMDFDRRGKQATNRLRKNLEHSGIKVNLQSWKMLLSLVGRDLQCLEGLGTYLENLKLKIGSSE